MRHKSASFALALACMPACLELNPDFIDPARQSDAAAGTAAAASATASADPTAAGETGTSSDTAADANVSDCTPAGDPFEPNDLSDPSDVPIGVLDAEIGSNADVDGFKTYLEPAAPVVVFARLNRNDLRACIYARCENGNTATIPKCQGVTATHPGGYPGCCGIGVTALEYDCAGSDIAIFFTQVDTGPGECAAYELEIGTNPVP